MSLPLHDRTKTTSHCIPVEPSNGEFPQPIKTDLSSSLKESEESQLLHFSPVSLDLVLHDEVESQSQIDVASINLFNTCCGDNCCKVLQKNIESELEKIEQPDNKAYRSLHLNIESVPTILSGVPGVPPRNVSILPIRHDISPASVEPPVTHKRSDPVNSISKTSSATATDVLAIDSSSKIDTTIHPPSFVQPHAPYNVYSARVFSARQLTKPGAEKRTYHFDLDVTDYPDEMGVDFKVGGAIGISAPNNATVVEELLDLLCVPRRIRDQPILLKTSSGRWPTVWGEDEPRELVTTRRDILTWCSDFQSFRISKSLLRLLAEHTISESEKKILLYLTSDQGQSTFCDLRTGPYITVPQLLHAFPSCKPPLDSMLSVLPQLMPRFYSISNDPHDTCVSTAGSKRIIEFAITVWEIDNWDETNRTGLASGFLERQAQKFIEAEGRGEKQDLRIPIFKGLMANPLARDFTSDGPMLLIGAGVGIAPFRGFVQRRLRNASCANKVWVLQGIRDSLLDELYSGEWGVHEREVKKVVESRQRSGQCKYVQDEVRAQADLVWFIINSLDGRIFVCGSSQGMSQGVDKALTDVAILKGNLEENDAKKFWEFKKKAGQYVVEAWS